MPMDTAYADETISLRDASERPGVSMNRVHVGETYDHDHVHHRDHAHDHAHDHDHTHHHDHTHDHDHTHHHDHAHDHTHDHGHGHHHDHTHGMAKESLRTAFFLTCVILLASFIGGLLAHSLALLSDATHTLTDLLALGMAWFAAEQAERPANEYKTFGYHRVGILAAFLNAITLILIALVIFWEAIQRFQHPEPVEPLIMFGSATLAIAINLFIGFGLSKDEHNLNVRAAALHVFGDVGVSAAVVVAGVIVLLTGWTFVDPLLSIAVALLLAFGTRGIIRETTNILLEAVPKHISLKHLTADMQKVTGVRAVHDLHVWSVSGGVSALSCHVLVDNLSLGESTHILHVINDLLRERYRIDHVTIQFECSQDQITCSCDSNGCYCCFVPSVTRHDDHDHSEITYGDPRSEGQSSIEKDQSWVKTSRVRLVPLDAAISPMSWT
jgi:cobalt-zinc-cadmium efflux system protein